MSVTTIPCLPCVDLPETIAFYEGLGFRVTYQQKSPNSYGVLRRDDWELHFFGFKGFEAVANYSTALVIVPEVEQMHAAFADMLRATFGKLPIRGFPHITRMRPGQGRFTIVDPSGNSVIYIKQAAHEKEASNEAVDSKTQSPLEKALAMAARLRDSKNDDRAAAKHLDVVLAKHPDAPVLERARVIGARAELAVALDEIKQARQLLQQLNDLPINAADRKKYRDEFEAAERLLKDVE
jgi:catechol 2,3-dioxygenase-like lactoylglutathione lyase family enzyme